MKKNILLFLLFIIAFISTVNAQVNAWVDHSLTYYKLKTNTTGLARIPFSTLQNNNLVTEATAYAIYYKGKEIPLYINQTGTMQSGSYIEFYTQKNDGEFDTPLYQYAQHQPDSLSSIFTDTSAYFLVLKPLATNLRFIPNSTPLPTPAPTPETYFMHTSYRQIRSEFFGGKPAEFSSTNVNLADYEENEGVMSFSINENDSLAFQVKTNSVYNTGGTAQIETRIAGGSNNKYVLNDHHVLVRLNGTLYIDTIYEGYNTQILNFEAPLSALGANTTEIRFKSDASTNNFSVNKNRVAYIKITYPHSFDFNNQKNYDFYLYNTNDKYIEISNYNGGNTPVLYDLTHAQRFEPIIENNIYKFFIPKIENGNEKRHFYIANTTAIGNIPNINKLEAVKFKNYELTENQGDYIIITHPSLREGNVDYVTEYAQFRASPEGGNYKVVAINIEELYNQFAWGIDKHPRSIRNFIDLAFAKWANKPKFLLLLGKSVSYNYCIFDGDIRNKNLVPSYGAFSSDIMLSTSNIYNYRPRLATGRVSAQSANDVRIFLSKLKTYTAYKSLPCTRPSRLYTKEALHIAGGDNIAQSNEFLGYLSKYKKIYEDSLMAGKVALTYNKISDNTIEQIDLKSLINNGLHVINFLGHSSGQYWNVNLNQPTEYQNYGKFPFIFTGSCFVGDIHQYVPNERPMPEDYLFAENLGGIGFLASSTVGFPNYLSVYTESVYKKYCKSHYNAPIGYCISKAVRELDSLNLNSAPTKMTCQSYAYAGDPALQLSFWEKPEYLIENNDQYADISFLPASISADIDSFLIKIIVTNLGKAVYDSFTINIARTLPNGTTVQTLNKRVLAPIFSDTLLFYIKMGDPFLAAGNNVFLVTIDSQNEINEDCENNNAVSVNLFVFSNMLIPISPCNFSIVNQPNITLKASTGQPLLPTQTYLMEIDTSQNFNSPALQQTTIQAQSGVIAWQPTFNYTANTVYYWRATPAILPYKWRMHSFTYLPNSSAGWNQQHYGQFKANELQGSFLDSTSYFNLKYDTITNIIKCKNQYFNLNSIKYYVNGNLLSEGTCLNNECVGGVSLVAFPPSYALIPLNSVHNPNTAFGCAGKGTFDNIHCSFVNLPRFEFNTATASQFTAMQNFINSIPNDYYIMAYSVNNHHCQNTNPNASVFYDLLNSMGLNQVNNILDTVPFIAFGKKVADNNFIPKIVVGNTQYQDIELVMNILGKKNTGNMQSTIIGPSKKWQELQWQTYSKETPNTDSLYFEIWGLQNNTAETLLATIQANNINNFNLNTIDAQQFRFLKIKTIYKDTLNFSPPRFEFWRVLYEGAPEFALNYNQYFEFNADTLLQGNFLSLKMALMNASGAISDSLKVAYTIISTATNTPQSSTVQTYAPLLPQQNLNLEYSYKTDNLQTGSYILAVNINPTDDQPEKFKFNNLIFIPFYIKADVINPVIDVTFDGKHIVNGDIVSAKPVIKITLKDDNRFLALNDTANFEMKWQYPIEDILVNTEQPIYFNQATTQFEPATNAAAQNGNNRATITLTPTFTQNGLYTLKLRAKDRSNNPFSNTTEYKIGFNVITEQQISEVFNYPNPFSSSTQFVFTLTGSTIPTHLNIKIMTISGKVVRQITSAELGNLRIGNNITDFVWDGTDQYGNPLANGVYLYKVSAEDENGTTIQKFDTQNFFDTERNTSEFFKNGWGKMYLMR